MFDWFKKQPETGSYVNCFFCKIPSPAEDIFDLQIKTSEGPHSVKICELCATTMEEMKKGGSMYE
jgi:hypothetical protein